MSQPDFSWTQTDDRAVMAAPGIRVLFTRIGPSWTHGLERLDHEGLEVVRAIEHDPDRDHPARIVSPLYQELKHHELPNSEGLCVLLTGHLHQHHFSAAIRLFALSEQPGRFILDIDVADRCRVPVESLAATYLVRLDSGALADASPESIVWNPSGTTRGRLELNAQPPAVLALAEGGRNATRAQAVAKIEPNTFTHRLRYRWCWTSAPGLT